MTRSMLRIALGPVGFAVAALVCLVAMTLAQDSAANPGAAPEPVSPVIYPEQRMPLRFSHVQHLTLPGPDAPTCTSCHTQAASSRSSLDNLIPGEAACARCHDIDRAFARRMGRQPGASSPSIPASIQPTGACQDCHLGYDPATRLVERVYIPAPNIKFDHAAHVSRGMACTGCHGDFVAEGVTLATRDQLPAMSLCLGCHDGKRASSRCTTCHLAAPGGRMHTEFASGALEPTGPMYGAAHDLTFRSDHAAAAQNNMDYCGSCHRKRDCVDCHNGVARPMDFHGNDYVSLHAIDARRNTPDCGACHRSQTFCTGCHSRAGVSADGRGSEFDARLPSRRFHPEGWAEAGMRGPNHHAFEAQRNIQQCAACHREQFCVGCHSNLPDSMGVNPHPAGFATSSRCRALLARNARVCLRCHVGMDEARCQ